MLAAAQCMHMRHTRHTRHAGDKSYYYWKRQFDPSEAAPKEDAKVRKRIDAGRRLLPEVVVSDTVLEHSARLCLALGTDGLRGELTVMRAARALAAYEGDREVTLGHVRRVGPPALRHRLRRDPLDDAGSSARVERALADLPAA